MELSVLYTYVIWNIMAYLCKHLCINLMRPFHPISIFLSFPALIAVYSKQAIKQIWTSFRCWPSVGNVFQVAQLLSQFFRRINSFHWFQLRRDTTCLATGRFETIYPARVWGLVSKRRCRPEGSGGIKVSCFKSRQNHKYIYLEVSNPWGYPFIIHL